MFVEQLLLKNFKSFKENEIHFDKGFNALVGPNGSGKSNLCDGVMFAFGESSLKSMRVKKTRDLIFGNANAAEVTVLLSDDNSNKHEIKRFVRKNGDTKYMLNGRRVKKYVLNEFLSRQRLYTHNVIRQGQVQHIVEISSKDRRVMIDSVANISEYESKKKEALSELNQVQDKLNSASAILSEKEGYVKELEGEKRDAERFLELKNELDTAKASLIYIDIKTHSAEFEEIVKELTEFNARLGEIRKKIEGFGADLTEKNVERQKVHDQIVKRSQGKQLILQQEIDELTSSIERSKAIIEEKNKFLSLEGGKLTSLKTEKIKADDEVNGYLTQVKKLSEDFQKTSEILKREQDSLNSIIKESDVFTSEFHAARKFLENANEETLKCKEQLSEVQAQAGKFAEIRKLKLAELDRLKGGTAFEEVAVNKDKLKEKLKSAIKAADEVDKEVNQLYAKEKKLNNELKDVEDTLLTVRTKLAELNSRLKTLKESDQSRAVAYAQSLELTGVYGTVEELCKYDDKEALAIQAALGSRANYLIVDSSRTASKVIEELKKSKSGRAAFIPLDKIKGFEPDSQEVKYSKSKDCKGFLIDFVEFEESYKKAFQYIFGSTLLFPSLKEGESLIGKVRFATIDGQLAEASGVMLGGSASRKISTARDLKILEELKNSEKSLQNEKDRVLNELYLSRDDIALKRKLKAKSELELKAVEIELAALNAREETLMQKKADIGNAIKQLKLEVAECEKEIEKADEERSRLIRRLSDLNVRALDAKQRVDVEKDKNFGFTIREREKKISDLKIEVADLKNQIESLNSRAVVYERQSKMLQKQIEDTSRELGEAETAVSGHYDSIKTAKRELQKKHEEQRNLSTALKELYDYRDKIENEIQKIGTEKGRLEFERDKIDKEVNSRNIRRAVVETNLTNFKAEFSPFEQLEILNKDKLIEEQKPTFLARTRELQGEIDAIGNVNLKAIELFGIKFRELEEQRSRVDQLHSEKESVLKLVDEIEGKKILTFMEAFNMVNDNFKKLFKQIFKGDGELYLESAENPFEGGLTIKVQIENKEVKYLELMSGGEKSLVALMFLFAIQSYNPSSVYILDEADSALDQENSRKLAELLKKLSKDSQFLVISHNQTVYKEADNLTGIAMTGNGSALVEVKLNEAQPATA